MVEICRKHGIRQRSFYLCKKKYAGLGLSELREIPRLRSISGNKNTARRPYFASWTIAAVVLKHRVVCRRFLLLIPRYHEVGHPLERPLEVRVGKRDERLPRLFGVVIGGSHCVFH